MVNYFADRTAFLPLREASTVVKVVWDVEVQSARKAVLQAACMPRRCRQGGSRRGLAWGVMPTGLHVTRQ